MSCVVQWWDVLFVKGMHFSSKNARLLNFFSKTAITNSFFGLNYRVYKQHLLAFGCLGACSWNDGDRVGPVFDDAGSKEGIFEELKTRIRQNDSQSSSVLPHLDQSAVSYSVAVRLQTIQAEFTYTDGYTIFQYLAV